MTYEHDGALCLSDGRSLRLPKGRGRLGSERVAVLGIRPTHIAPASGAPPRPGVVRETIVIDLIQPTGARSFVSFRLGEATVTAEFDAHAVLQPGERLPVDFDLNRAVLIDPETNRVLP